MLNHRPPSCHVIWVAYALGQRKYTQALWTLLDTGSALTLIPSWTGRHTRPYSQAYRAALHHQMEVGNEMIKLGQDLKAHAVSEDMAQMPTLPTPAALPSLSQPHLWPHGEPSMIS